MTVYEHNTVCYDVPHHCINNIGCFMLLLDVSIAFDLIEFFALFNHLRSRNTCPVTTFNHDHVHITENAS